MTEETPLISEPEIVLPDKIVVFISGKDEVLVNRLKSLNEGNFILIDHDYTSVIPPTELKNRPSDKGLKYFVQTIFGKILRDGKEKLIIVLKDNLSIEYVKAYEEVAKDFHKKECQTVDLETTIEKALEDSTEDTLNDTPLLRSFFFVSGPRITMIEKLVFDQKDSVFIKAEDIASKSLEYLDAVNKDSLKLVLMHTRGIIPEVKEIFKFFLPLKGYGIANIRIKSFTPVLDSEITIEKLAVETGIERSANDSDEVFAIKVLAKRLDISKGFLTKFEDPAFKEKVFQKAREAGYDLEEMGLV